MQVRACRTWTSTCCSLQFTDPKQQAFLTLKSINQQNSPFTVCETAERTRQGFFVVFFLLTSSLVKVVVFVWPRPSRSVTQLSKTSAAGETWCFLARVESVGLTEVMTGEYTLWVSASCSVAAWSGRKMTPSCCRMTLKKQSYSSVLSSKLTPRLTINDMTKCFCSSRLLHSKGTEFLSSLINPAYIAYITFITLIYSSIPPPAIHSIHPSYLFIHLPITPAIHPSYIFINPSIHLK